MYIQNLLLNLKAAREGGVGRPLLLLCFVAAAIVAPFLLLTIGSNESNNLPWYFWAILALVLVGVISAAILRFARESRGADDMSISPGPPRKRVERRPESQ